ncbi:MAG TPA: zinc ABC transporter substrate-binding protein, partial [Candidatus Omnitrophota bacterium]|nr:zinc ABC transporter substrate-binding protein [Candidatus Omnitrophota bacterium]
MWKPLAAILMALSLAHPANAEPPKVVVSIQPLHSLAAGVMKGVAEPALLVTGAQSEHTYSLRPSDARMIEAADLVILADPAFEAFLAKPLKRSGANAFAMSQVPGVTRLAKREGGVWSHDDHDHGADFDGHLWLDPTNAKLFAAALAQRLAAHDPANAATYRANANALEARLDALDSELKARLA